MKSFWKTYTLWISLGIWLVSMGGQYAGVIPSPYGLVVGNGVVIVYVTMCLSSLRGGEGIVSSPASEAITKVEEKDRPKTDTGRASADQSPPDKNRGA